MYQKPCITYITNTVDHPPGIVGTMTNFIVITKHTGRLKSNIKILEANITNLFTDVISFKGFDKAVGEVL